jgi:hypothetical protein
MSTDRHWVRNLILIPTLVTVISLIATSIIQSLLGERRQLSYSIRSYRSDSLYTCRQSPSGTAVQCLALVIIDPDSNRRIPVQMMEARVWNSGTVPLKDLPVYYHFRTTEPDTLPPAIRHYSNPWTVAPSIHPDSVILIGSGTVFQYHYSLLNPGDEVTLIAFGDNVSSASVEARAEGLRVREGIKPVRRVLRLFRLALLAAIAAFLAALLTSVNWPVLWRHLRR